MPSFVFRIVRKEINSIAQISIVADYGCNSPFESSFKMYTS